MINTSLIYLCKVLYVTDNSEGLRIKVRIKNIDGDKPISELPYVFPLLPKFVHVNPKAEEMVMVFLQSPEATDGNRFFLGPVISQPQMMYFDKYDYSAGTLLNQFSVQEPLPSPRLNPENKGTLPDREDIAIEGRGNSDIILKENELRFRCGFKENYLNNKNECMFFNKDDVAYIQMKYQKTKDHKNQGLSSVINIVADRINLLSHDSNTSFNLTDPDNLITDEEMQKIFSEGHQMVYGDELVKFLKKLIHAIQNHTHSFPMDNPLFRDEDLKTLSSDLNVMLSNSIRIN